VTGRLVIVGGGHAHLFVLEAFARQPEPGVRLQLISPHERSVYTGMAPGVIAEQYRLDEAEIDVRRLTERAGGEFLGDRVVGMDPRAGSLELAGGGRVPYDVLSLDIGGRPAGAERIAPEAPAVVVKPIEEAVRGIAEALASAPRRAVVVGAGAGGCDLAFALARRLGAGAVSVCDADPRPLLARGERASRLVEKSFSERGVSFLGGARARRVERGRVELDDGRSLAADLVVWSTGAVGPALLRASGLPVDERGFLRVESTLRCVGVPALYAAGDCATIDEHPDLPKAGVYAVRQGPVLARNLRDAIRGRPPGKRFRPQREFLALINTADGKAILSYGKVALRGCLAWRLKDRIDRAFVRRFA
jgi:selenide, water dikinase